MKQTESATVKGTEDGNNKAKTIHLLHTKYYTQQKRHILFEEP